MARRGGYKITPTWQSAARSRLAELQWTEKQLSKKLRCAQSTVHDVLNSPEQKSSSLVPRINQLFGWQQPPEDMPHAPSPPIPTSEATEAAAIFDQLPEPLRKAKLEELRAILALVRPAND